MFETSSMVEPGPGMREASSHSAPLVIFVTGVWYRESEIIEGLRPRWYGLHQLSPGHLRVWKRES